MTIFYSMLEKYSFCFVCQYKLNNPSPSPVILAPHGLSGVLTGVTYWESEPTGTTSKMFTDWAGYFPIKETMRDDGGKLPSMVEVVVGEFIVKYRQFTAFLADAPYLTI